MPEFPAELLPFLLKADTTSRASNADILSFFSKTPLLIDRLRYIRESYKVVFTELLLDDDTRVGFYKESNGLLLWQGSYLTRSAESHLSWHSVTAAISALVDNHELIAAIDPKKAVSQDEQLSFDLPENEQVLMLLDLGFAAEGFVPLPNNTSRKPLEETVQYL